MSDRDFDNFFTTILRLSIVGTLFIAACIVALVVLAAVVIL